MRNVEGEKGRQVHFAAGAKPKQAPEASRSGDPMGWRRSNVLARTRVMGHRRHASPR